MLVEIIKKNKNKHLNYIILIINFKENKNLEIFKFNQLVS